mmetsp:Transcript_1690/g.3485  ORF Transcript_1690/g.3485 Transcript_1690/m.3485 type:complete len:234 (+) Transcript_1690:1563-2264(+)
MVIRSPLVRQGPHTPMERNRKLKQMVVVQFVHRTGRDCSHAPLPRLFVGKVTVRVHVTGPKMGPPSSLGTLLFPHVVFEPVRIRHRHCPDHPVLHQPGDVFILPKFVAEDFGQVRNSVGSEPFVPVEGPGEKNLWSEGGEGRLVANSHDQCLAFLSPSTVSEALHAPRLVLLLSDLHLEQVGKFFLKCLEASQHGLIGKCLVGLVKVIVVACSTPQGAEDNQESPQHHELRCC